MILSPGVAQEYYSNILKESVTDHRKNKMLTKPRARHGVPDHKMIKARRIGSNFIKNSPLTQDYRRTNKKLNGNTDALMSS